MRAILAIVILVAVAACSGTNLDASVTTFHSLPATPVGKTFIMVPIEQQAQSLEWRSYSDRVAQQLELKGLRRVSRSADYAIFMAYAVDEGRTYSESVPIYGQTSSGGTTTTSGYIGRTPVYGSTYTPPTFGIVGAGSSDTTVYARAVKIWIYETDKITSAPVYEATATSSGTTGTLAVVMPTIINAMFIDWPSPSGSTKNRVLPLVKN